MKPIPIAACGANNRAGQPCTRRPALGQTRCHFHGGAPRSGAQPGNTNAVKHGFYSARVREFATDLLAAADRPLDLHDEIALLRAVLARSAATAQPQTVALLASTLARLIRAQRQLPPIPAPPEALSPEELAEFDDLVAQLQQADLEADER